ncbi:MAG: DUF262 domain-containing protein [Arcobacteraceae bacterium]|jgi:hypothetical protein|nr:DUF262 domain-containing protein [Arcobacteraceae bacterium]
MSFWLLIAAPDKWFCDSCKENANVNDALFNLSTQTWRVGEDYFKHAEIGDKCIIKVSKDNRSIERRTLKNGDIVDILESGIYGLGEIIQEINYDSQDDCHRIRIKITRNLFQEHEIITQEIAEQVLGNDFISLSSKKIDNKKYHDILSIIENEEYSNTKDDNEITNHISDIEDIYPASINVSKDDSSVYELKRQYEMEPKRIQLSPPYQRGSVWSSKQKSELIESILMGIPLPIMYFFQDNSGVKQVVDGKQRLTTLFDFMKNSFALTELSVMKDLKGKKFRDLNGLDQGKIEDYKIPINVIKPPTPDRIKFDIFDRVNRGGTRLNNQEMRNAIYQGRATELLEELKNNEDFKKATDYSIRSKVMKDRYMILRFIAFYLWKHEMLKNKDGSLIEYKSDIDAFLGKTMEFLNFTDEETILKAKKAFESAMTNACHIFGQRGFRVSTYFNEAYKRSVNMALFDSLTYLLSDTKVQINSERVKILVQELFKDNEFNNSITSPVDSSTKVISRFYKMDGILKELRK